MMAWVATNPGITLALILPRATAGSDDEKLSASRTTDERIFLPIPLSKPSGGHRTMPIKVDIIFLWLRRSQECRTQADQMKHPQARQRILAAAERYEMMAEEAAEKLSREVNEGNTAIQRITNTEKQRSRGHPS
jgi:hypothetical protein